MKFKMNDRNWEIVELSQEDMQQHFKDYKWDGEPQKDKYFGLTYFDEQKIYIDKDLHVEQKVQTLLHELMHCYIGSYLSCSQEQTFNEELLCDISANSHIMITNIICEYFNNNEKKHNNSDKFMESIRKLSESYEKMDRGEC